MLSAPDLLVACPHCQGVARVFEIASANVLGAITWTDGYTDAPLMPRPPRITRCPACARIFWTGEASPLGFSHSSAEIAGKQEWTGAPHLEPLDEAGVMQAIAEGLAYAPELELELRVLMWWRGNDAFRKGETTTGHAATGTAIANMERFIEMMTAGDEDLLLFRTEALRHLGRFDEANETLKGVGCSDYWPAKHRQLELIRERDRKLRKLFVTAEANGQESLPLSTRGA